MRGTAALLACALLIAAGCGGGGGEAVTTGTTRTGATGDVGNDRRQRDAGAARRQAGKVLSVLPDAQQGATRRPPVGSGDALFAGNELATRGSASQLTFQLDLGQGPLTATCPLTRPR